MYKPGRARIVASSSLDLGTRRRRVEHVHECCRDLYRLPDVVGQTFDQNTNPSGYQSTLVADY